MYKKALIVFLSYIMVFVGFTSHVSAAVIGTQQALSMEARGVHIAEIQARLASHEVQAAMIKLGVDPAQASLRVAALSDDELMKLDNQLDSLPAGGDGTLALIGAVFVVLLILEVTGVINIFKKP